MDRGPFMGLPPTKIFAGVHVIELKNRFSTTITTCTA